MLGFAPAWAESRVTTPLVLEVDVDEPDDVVPDEAPPEPPPKPPVPEPPDGREVLDGDGAGEVVRVGVGVGVGVGLGDGDGDGLPESPLDGSAWAAAGLSDVNAAKVGEPGVASLVVAAPDVALVLPEVALDALDVPLLAAPPPSAIDVAPSAEPKVKSACTVWEMVPVAAFAVR